MQLIDDTYFVGELNIANTDNPAVIENLNGFINKYQIKYLKMLLGDSLYAEFIAGITPVPIPGTDPQEYAPIDAKWANLLNAIVQSDIKVCPIANFVYFYFVRDQAVYNAGINVVVAKGENSVTADSKVKTARAWNEMNELSYEVYKFLKVNVCIYGVIPYQVYFNYNFFGASLDWYSWWWGYGIRYSRYIPEIYKPINILNI